MILFPATQRGFISDGLYLSTKARLPSGDPKCCHPSASAGTDLACSGHKAFYVLIPSTKDCIKLSPPPRPLLRWAESPRCTGYGICGHMAEQKPGFECPRSPGVCQPEIQSWGTTHLLTCDWDEQPCCPLLLGLPACSLGSEAKLCRHIWKESKPAVCHP